MAGVKPLTKIYEKTSSVAKPLAKKLGRQTLPVKSELKGLVPLEKDTITLNRFNSQSERLKDFYNSKGIPYLLPHEEWSDKKILDTIKLLGKDLDKLAELKTLNKETLQEALEKLVPEVKGTVIIKDFADFKKDLTAAGMNKESIEHWLESNAIIAKKIDKTTVYLKFEKLNGDKFEQVSFKKSVEHELEHALESRQKNTEMTDLYKNNIHKCHNQSQIFNMTFGVFENNYLLPFETAKTELTQENMLKQLGFNSIEKLHNDFEKTLNNIIKETKSTGSLNIGSDKKSWKQFYTYLKEKAISEKNAYQANTRLREVNGDLDTPTESELIPLVYGEMEKFFNKKRVQVNKQI